MAYFGQKWPFLSKKKLLEGAQGQIKVFYGSSDLGFALFASGALFFAQKGSIFSQKWPILVKNGLFCGKKIP